jgi:hypothetical protein
LNLIACTFEMINYRININIVGCMNTLNNKYMYRDQYWNINEKIAQ